MSCTVHHKYRIVFNWVCYLRIWSTECLFFFGLFFFLVKSRLFTWYGICFSALGPYFTYSGTSMLCLFYKNENVVLWLALLIATPKLKLTHTKKEKKIPLYFPSCNSCVTAKSIWDLQFNTFKNFSSEWEQRFCLVHYCTHDSQKSSCHLFMAKIIFAKAT